MRSLGWTLIQHGRGPYKKRRSGPRHTGMTTWGHRDRTAIYMPRRSQPCWHPDPWLPASRTWGSKPLEFKPPVLWTLLRGPSRLIPWALFSTLQNPRFVLDNHSSHYCLPAEVLTLALLPSVAGGANHAGIPVLQVTHGGLYRVCHSVVQIPRFRWPLRPSHGATREWLLCIMCHRLVQEWSPGPRWANQSDCGFGTQGDWVSQSSAGDLNFCLEDKCKSSVVACGAVTVRRGRPSKRALGVLFMLVKMTSLQAVVCGPHPCKGSLPGYEALMCRAIGLSLCPWVDLPPALYTR